ncbi:MAG: diguanylate cyclase [Planctomycetota bacterium]|nr:diguanylate cyclase [Planctomycetota bacterium]
MARLNITSPGILLILAVLLAGAIFLLDAFYLKPYMAGQEWDTLRQQASRTQSCIAKDIQDLGEKLQNLGGTSAQGIRMRTLAATGRSGQLEALAAPQFCDCDVDMVWLCRPDGAVIDVWLNGRSSGLTAPLAAGIRASVVARGGRSASSASGLVTVDTHTVVFARRRVPHPDDPTLPAGELWIARAFDQSLLSSLRSVEYADLTFAPEAPLPSVRQAEDAAGCRFWLRGTDELAVAWILHDVHGRALGCLRAVLDVPQIHLQASSARRMTLIILSLSAGAILMVIVATHILIAGPVLRLLRRLQMLDSGQKVAHLTKDLHGEPLVLARRLESAFDRLAHMSKTDELTGLANRRHFTEVLHAFYHQARRYNRPLSLIQIDIDFFKAANDACGHQGGDELLRIVARAIESACRKADLPARCGGDEFAILLPETSSLPAAVIAERIRQSVSQQSVTIEGLNLKVSLSIGIADLNAGEISSPEGMLALADRAMYAAKELGRDRVVQAHDLAGVSWTGEAGAQKVDTLHKKLAGLDGQFKGLFLQAIQEVVQVLEERDPYMVAHALKVKHVAVRIAQEMELPDRVIARIEIAGMLHDIGMLALPDSILLCPGELDERQWQAMRRHPLLSVRIMEGMEFLEQEIPAVRYHHERFDGKGYPEGISGASIPLTARILAVAEAFVGMTSPRSFRDPKSLRQAADELLAAAGTQFDPAVVEAFEGLVERAGEELLDVGTAPSHSSVQELSPALADA